MHVCVLGHCENGKVFTETLLCPEDTTAANYCVVPKDKADSICSRLPDCKYVGTTTSARWNSVYKNSAQLGKGELIDNSGWTSCTPKGNACASVRLSLCVCRYVCMYVCTVVHVRLCMYGFVCVCVCKYVCI